MSDDRIVGERYAKAVYAVAARDNEQNALDAEFKQAALLLHEHPMLFKLLTNPVLAHEKKTAIVQAVFGSVLSPVGLSAIQLLIRKNRMRYFFAVARCISDIFNKAQNRLDVRAVSALPMAAVTQEKIAALLRSTFGKEVVLHCETDPDLLGGVKLHVGDRVIDGSVKYQLRQMASHLVTM